MIDIIIRKGKEADLEQALTLVKELAAYEKAPDEVEVTLKEMHNWGFGKDKLFEFFVAEHQDKVVGIALYYYKYSTWKGKCLFLEDIIVTSTYRRYGLGSKLFNQVALVAKQQQVRRMEWQVLDWNKPAIDFYKKYNAHFDEEWLNGKLSHQQLQSF
ncbi:MAG: GNAT family N-acetyltransferase [Bacteroidia bacterium]